ncbi:MAG TPA: hypothetical protein PK611_08935, partial [Saprospiraceae bacterium]|nr:hypothetical protein [Saprospiraceae bacterium]
MKFNLYNIRKDVSLLLVLFFAFTVGLYSQPCPGVPSISSMVFSPADACTNGNHAIVNAVVAPTNPGSGYEYRYSLDGSPSFANSLPSGVPAGPHCITIAVFATTTVTCGGNTYNAGDMIPGTTNTYSIFFGSAGPPAFAASSIIGNLTCAATISVIPNPLYSCFTYEYSIDGGAWISTIPGTLTRGCHTISYRLNSSSSGFFGCGTGSPTPASANTNFVLFDDLSAAPITLTTTCSDGTNGTISSVNNLPAAVPGLTVEYSVDGGPYSTTLPTNLIPGCHNLMIREMADCPNSTADGDAPRACRAVINFVIYPTAPVITAPANTCAVAFTLPSVPVVTGFDVEYSIDGGAWSSAPTTTTPGCHTVSARYVLASACGALPYNIIPAGTFSNGVSSTCIASSNVVNVVIFPAAPVIAAPANTCASAFTLPSVPAVTGFNVQWSIDGGAFTSTPVIPTTPGCHNVRAQYVLGAACGTTPAGATGSGACGISNRVNVFIFPQAPVITAPANTCNA